MSQSSSPAPASAPSPNPTAKRPPETGPRKELIDSILIAFILAFVFRSFITEPFVIPTGSMATTLLGAHMPFYCEDCGTHFVVNWSVRMGDGKTIWAPSNSPYRHQVFCKHCGHQVQPTSARDADNDATRPSVRYGDRILVLKYRYLLREPTRYDVVVFKNPAELEVNFIKRLVGLPGETLIILDGDIYVKSEDGWELQRKPHYVQESLWRVVYNHDFQPQRKEWATPWQSESDAWDLSSRQGEIRFKSEGGADLNFVPVTTTPPYHFTDWSAYNHTNGQEPRRQNGERLGSALDFYNREVALPSKADTVQDLRIKMVYERKSGDGDFQISLKKFDDTFTARLGKDAGVLMRNGAPISEPFAVGAGPMSIEFENVDYRVKLRINGSEVASTLDRGSDANRVYKPDVRMLLDKVGPAQRDYPEVSMSAAAQECRLTHVSLWRDVYYKNYSQRGGIRWGFPPSSRQNSGEPVVLGGDEFFVIGDNPELSEDARLWTRPLDFPNGDSYKPGRVPRRLMLGKAFFVYWPAGHPILGIKSIPMNPNFGEMRFIH